MPINATAPAEQSAYQGLATAAHTANNAYFAAFHTLLDTTITNADSFFQSGLPLLQTVAAAVSAAGQTAISNISGAGTGALSSIASARQTRDTAIVNAEAARDQAIVPLADGIVLAGEQLEVDQAILGATQECDSLENTPDSEFAGLLPGGGGMASMLAAAVFGADPNGHKARFLETITDPQLRGLIDNATKNGSWGTHHTYQQAEAVQDFLREMKPGFDVQDPKLTRAVPDHIHDRISAEQRNFWLGQWNSIPDAQKRKLLGNDHWQHYTIGNVIKASEDREKLLGKLENMIQDQEKFFSPFWLSQGATKADLNKLAGKLRIDTSSGGLGKVFEKVTNEAAQSKFRELYSSRLKEVLGKVGSAKITTRIKNLTKHAGNLAIIATALSGIANDMALAGDPNAAEWENAYQEFSSAAGFQAEHGYPSGYRVANAKAALIAALDSFQSTDDSVAIAKFYIHTKLEAEVFGLR